MEVINYVYQCCSNCYNFKSNGNVNGNGNGNCNWSFRTQGNW